MKMVHILVRTTEVWTKVRGGFLVDGAARLTDFSCSQVGPVLVGDSHTVALGAGLKKAFDWMTSSPGDSSPGLQVPARLTCTLAMTLQWPLQLTFTLIWPCLRWRLGPTFTMLWQHLWSVPCLISYCDALMSSISGRCSCRTRSFSGVKMEHYHSLHTFV